MGNIRIMNTCPKCRTSYDVPIKEENPDQKVRCAKCSHVWQPALDVIDPLSIELPQFQTPAPEEPDMPIPSFQNFFKEPEKEDTSFIKWLKPLYFFSLFCIAAAIYLFFFHPEKRAPVTLQTVSYELVEKDYKTYLSLKAAAFNNTDAAVKPKAFTARFMDENNRVLTTAAVSSPVETLPPRDVTEIHLLIERPPSKTAKVILILTETVDD